MNKDNGISSANAATPCDKIGKNNAFLCYAVVAAAYLVASIVLGSIQNAVTKGSAVWWICLAAANLVVGISAALFLRCNGGSVWRDTAADVAPNPVHTLLCCVCAVGLVFCMSYVTNALFDLMESWGLPRPSVDLPKQLVPLLLTATFLPAVSEELAFRGVVAQGLLRGSGNKVGGVVLSGALFALFHANPAQTLHQFLFGCLLAVLYLRGGSLWSCVIVHFVNNLVVVGAEFLLPESIYTDLTVCIVGGVVAALSFAAYILFVKPTSNSMLRESFVVEKSEPVSVVAFVTSVAVFVVLWVAALV